MNMINEDYADYNAFSNQVYLSGNPMFRNDMPHLPAKLKPKYAEHEMKIDYSGGITHKNSEGYLGGIHLGVDVKRRFKPNRPINKLNDSDSSSDSSSDSDSDSDSDYDDVPNLHELLEHLADLNLDHKTHSDICLYLDKMEKAGRGLKGRGSIWSWVKNKANKVADFGKKAYKFAEEKIKPIAKVIIPLLKLHPKAGEAIDRVKNAANAIPIVGSDAKKKLEEYGMGKKKGGAVSTIENPFTNMNEKTDVVTVGNLKKVKVDKSKYPKEYKFNFLDTNENALIGVPARLPNKIKNTGIHFQGATLGAGESGGAVLGGPSNDPVNGKKIKGMGKKKGKGKGKTGSALFDSKGIFPLETKQSEPLTLDEQRKTNYIPNDESKVLGGNLLGDLLIHHAKTIVKPIIDNVKNKVVKKVGGTKPASKWVDHVKNYAKEHGISYKLALSQAKATYNK
jgi:hypothetical protein